MKTRIEIIQRLLDKSQITAEEAVTLLTKEVEYKYYPYSPYQPYYPWTSVTYSGSENLDSMTYNS